MKTGKIIEAIEKWSPKGLCADSFVLKNGDKRRTEACSMGCLLLETLYYTEAGVSLRQKYEVKKRIPHNVLEDIINNNQLTDAAYETFGLDEGYAEDIIRYNDTCLESTEEKLLHSSDKRSAIDDAEERLPRALKRCIKRLRKQYDAFLEVQGQE